MPRRLHQTLADYVVIAISPALIMLLVGSLVFFLLRVFYQGEFPERLHWVMACFVFAAVLIGRISIEEGFEKAAIYGAALALAVGVACNRFMEYQGSLIDTFSWPINFAMIGLIWWCAHKLTWDCTVIDDSQDASGEGLLQIAGLERPADERNAEADRERSVEGTTSREVPAGYWQRYVEHQRRPHAPGVWVVYFSLAALPLFGIGAWFIPAADVWGRRYVFWLLCVYVASGLALLVTTSFLGLRRYLRQRRIEMPTLMANLWLATGAAIILALLVLAALVPRPSAEYAVSELPFRVGSPDQNASNVAPVKRDGTQDDQPAPAASEKPTDEQTADEEQPQGEGNQPAGEAEGESASTTESAGSESQGKGKGSRSGERKGSQERNGAKGEQDQKSRQGAGEEKDRSASEEEGQSRLADAIKKQQEEEAAERDAQRQAAERQSAQSNPVPSTQEIIEPLLSPTMALIKWAMYALFILFVLFWMWRYRDEIAAAVRNFLRELHEWWQALWGGKRDYGLAVEEVVDVKVPPSPFSTYTDPFGAGTAERYSLEELVRYSFEAFEAWSREHGCQREPDQTPHELARDVAKLNAFMAVDARRIAELYARAAYAQGELPADAREQLQALWENMRASAGSVGVAGSRP